MIHKFASGKTDSADATLVQPSNWNDLHVRKSVSKSANYTVTTSDDLLYVTGGAGGVTITMPDPTTCAGQPFEVVKADSGAGAVTVSPNSTEKFCALNNLTATSYILLNPGQRAVFTSDGTNWWVSGAN